jgi:hypothetical protein
VAGAVGTRTGTLAEAEAEQIKQIMERKPNAAILGMDLRCGAGECMFADCAMSIGKKREGGTFAPPSGQM